MPTKMLKISTIKIIFDFV